MYVSRESLRKIHHAVSVASSTPSTADKGKIKQESKMPAKNPVERSAITPFLERLLREKKE